MYIGWNYGNITQIQAKWIFYGGALPFACEEETGGCFRNGYLDIL